MVSCKDLLNLNLFKYIKLIGGEGGIYKNVTWTYICETLDFSKWVNGGELIFLTGMGMNLDEKSLKDLILECEKQEISGLVILTNSEYIKEVPKSCIDLANKINLPLFNMAWDIKLIDVTKEVSNYIVERSFIKTKERELLKELIFLSDINKDRVYKLAKHCNFKINQSTFVAIFNIIDMDIDCLYYIIDYIKLQLNKHNVDFILDLFEKKVVCIVSDDMDNKDNIKNILININNYINNCKKSTLSIGRSYNSIFDIKYSYEEAINIYDFYSYENSNIKNIDFDNIGFYKLLFDFKDIDKLKLYKDEIIGKLLEYDKIKNTNFMETLKIYLFDNDNLVNTANKLFIHRNTLIYRINKIKSILNKDLENTIVKNELISAIMINNYLNYLENK